MWHVDDLKISHVDSSVVDDIIASLKEDYGQVGVERRDVATVDIPGAFLQTKMPEDEKDVHA